MGSKRDAPPEQGMLPIPEPILEHHLRSLGDAMENWRGTRRIPPVLLLTGPAGVGKRSMVHFLAQWIFCEKSGLNRLEDDPGGEAAGDLFGGAAPAPAPGASDISDSLRPCGQCVQCQRALHGNWVDFIEVGAGKAEAAADKTEAESKTETGTLKVEQLRELKASVGFGAHEGRYRIVLIPNADRMTPQAANSVLKILEETPRNWIFFLTASDPTLILPTVLSRCQSARLKPIPSGVLEGILEGDAVKRAICANLSQGSWAKALLLAEDESWEKRKQLFSFLREPREGMPALLDWASSEPRNLNLLLDQLEHCTAELVRWSISEQRNQPDLYRWQNSDGSAALVAHLRLALRAFGTPEGARAFWLERAERIARARREALLPLNRKLLIQDILLPWLEVTAKP